MHASSLYHHREQRGNLAEMLHNNPSFMEPLQTYTQNMRAVYRIRSIQLAAKREDCDRLLDCVTYPTLLAVFLFLTQFVNKWGFWDGDRSWTAAELKLSTSVICDLLHASLSFCSIERKQVFDILCFFVLDITPLLCFFFLTGSSSVCNIQILVGYIMQCNQLL